MYLIPLLLAFEVFANFAFLVLYVICLSVEVVWDKPIVCGICPNIVTRISE